MRYTDLPKFSESQILRYENIVQGRAHHFSCIFCNILVIYTGSEGPDLADFWEVPEIIQKVLEYVLEPKLAILG